jgi:hypothetical protein
VSLQVLLPPKLTLPVTYFEKPWVCSIMSRFGGNTSAPALAMPILCVAQFVVVLDATIVTTALPAIRQALGFSDAGLQWVFTRRTR